jgi:Putative peptidoglycan binding domain
MTTYEMGDSSVPVVPPARLPVYAFYLGGDTPHVWTPAEVAAISARWALPIWVNTSPAADGAQIGADFLTRCRQLGMPMGSTLALDIENVDQPAVIEGCDQIVRGAGHHLMTYESKGALASMDGFNGYRWVADWTGTPHLFPGSVATQYASAAMAGTPWDCSLIDATMPLWQINPPAVHHIPEVAVTVDLPELARGDRGPAVVRLQHLILAWNEHQLAGAGPDGIFGPETTSAVRAFQRVYGITSDPGTVDTPTWARLLTG